MILNVFLKLLVFKGRLFSASSLLLLSLFSQPPGLRNYEHFVSQAQRYILHDIKYKLHGNLRGTLRKLL